MTIWHNPFPIWNQSVVPCPVLTVASWLHTVFSRGRSGGLVFPSLSEFSTVYCDPHSWMLGIVNKAEIDVFLELCCFFHDPVDVGNLISGSPAFSKTSLNIWSSRFMYCWSLAWRILSITLLACERVQLCSSLSILWHCLSLGLEWKLTFSSPVATAEFSKFVGKLSAALSQHHLSGFEIAQYTIEC